MHVDSITRSSQVKWRVTSSCSLELHHSKEGIEESQFHEEKVQECYRELEGGLEGMCDLLSGLSGE